jgi:integrase
VSTSLLSRSPSAPSNLAEVLALIDSDDALPRYKRQDACSALRSFSKVLDRPLDQLPAHPDYVQQQLDGVGPALAGVSPAAWRNTVSRIRFALGHAGVAKIPGRYQEPLAPAWAALFANLEKKQLRVGLSRFAHWAGARGFAPEQVDDAVMEMYRGELKDGAVVKNPRRLHKTACTLWNRAAREIAAWPKLQVTVPSYSRAYIKPWEIFPASLKTDYDAYLDRLRGGDILTELDFRPLKPGSIKTRGSQLHEFISALVIRGRDPQTLCSLRDVVALDAVLDGLRFYTNRPGAPAMKHASDMAYLLLAIARHHVKLHPVRDADHLAELKKICRRIDQGRTKMTAKNQSRLRQFDDPANVHAFVTLPQRLSKQLSRAGTPTPAEALRVQTAVAIELLLMVPMRVGNLVALDIDRHIIRSVRRGAVHLSIPGSQVKNGFDIDAVLPDETVKLLDLYIDRFRPVLLRHPTSALFPGDRSGPKGKATLSKQISRCIEAECGLKVNPHLFRHIAAKLYLDAHPGAYGVVRLINGHHRVDTSTKYYAGFENQAAIRRYDEQILKIRTDAPPLPPTKRSRR